MRFDVKNGDGEVRTRLHMGPRLEDGVRIVKRLDDDTVVEVTLEPAELLGLHQVASGFAATWKERAETNAKVTPVVGTVVANGRVG